MEEARRTPSLIELQTFVSDAIRIVNDRPLTTISSTPDDLTRLHTPSCFLGQHLAPNTPVSAFRDRGDVRRDYEYCATLAQRFWLRWMKGYLLCLHGRNKWKTSGTVGSCRRRQRPNKTGSRPPGKNSLYTS